MSTHELTCPIDDASEGMVLSQDLRDAGGAVLLPAGATLSAASLNSLRRRGIETVIVVASAPPVDPAVLQAERERQCARLERLFRRSAAEGATPLLYTCLLGYRNRGT